MVEAEGVENFVLHSASEHAALSSQRDLLSSTLATNVGPTSDTQERERMIQQQKTRCKETSFTFCWEVLQVCII